MTPQEHQWARDFLKLILNSRLQVRQELLTDLKLWSSLLKILLYLWKPAIFLERVYDLERLMTRVMYKTATPRDLKSLSVTSLQLPGLKEQLKKLSGSKLINSLESSISTLEDISGLVENAIIDEPPVSVKDGGVIKDSFNEELDDLRHIMNSGKNIITEIEEREREETGIRGLKIGF